MTRHLPYWVRIYRFGSEHIFGVYVVTCDTWHSAISFDLVQGNMLVSQGKVLSPGNKGYMDVSVYVYLFPNFALFAFICQFQGFLPWCNSCTCPPPWEDQCAERKPAA